ncbi:MAG: GNAT family N-acetyltransferase [Thermomicrobiales bacterium]
MIDNSRTRTSLTLRRFDDPAAFSAAALPFLMAHEAEHCLPIGIVAGLIERPEQFEPGIYLATVERGGAVVAVAVRTPPWNVVLSRTSVSESTAIFAEDLLPDHPGLPGVLGPSALSRIFAEEWRRLTGRGYRLVIAQRIYQLETVTPVTGIPGALRRAGEADRELAIDWARAFWAEAAPGRDAGAAERSVASRLTSSVGGIFFWEDDGQPVSLVGYGGPTPNGFRIGPVFTPAEYRRQGYASAATAAVSQMLLDGGRRFCFLFTDLANPSSNNIYQAIGYRPVRDVDEYQFATA